MRFLFYLHDAVGFDHVQRNMALAARVAEMVPKASVLVAVGTDQVHWLDVPADVEVVELPSLGAIADGGCRERQLGIDTSELRALRAAVVETLVRSYRPDVMVVEEHPLGASGELRPALIALRAMGCRAVLGVPDILAHRETNWPPVVHEAIACYYDRVFVYGEREVFDPVETYAWPTRLAELVRFCGYVVSDFSSRDWEEEAPPAFLTRRRLRPLVLATAGSGEDDPALLSTFLDAAVEAPWDAAIVTGPAVSSRDLDRLRRWSGEAGVECLGFIPRLGRWFGAIDALVSTASYNTVTEALTSGLPTVCVPRVVPKVDEVLRARAFIHQGLVWGGDSAHLSPGALQRDVALALATPRATVVRRARRILDFDGARRAAEHLLELAAEPVGVRINNSAGRRRSLRRI
jgi:predicted glycosyltransferase